jgi:hypothetical protein
MMLTVAQKQAVEQAGVEVATLRLAAMSGSEPETPIMAYKGHPPKKRDVEVWLKSKLNLQRAGAIGLGLIIVGSMVAVVGGLWELARAAFL